MCTIAYERKKKIKHNYNNVCLCETSVCDRQVSVYAWVRVFKIQEKTKETYFMGVNYMEKKS